MPSSASFQPAAHTTTFTSEDRGVAVTVSTVVKVASAVEQTCLPSPAQLPSQNHALPPPDQDHRQDQPQPLAQQFPGSAIKPGYKTSEFWVTIVAQVVGLMTAMGVVSPAHSSDLSMAVNTIIGSLLALLPAVAYICNRTWLKTKSQPQQ